MEEARNATRKPSRLKRTIRRWQGRERERERGSHESEEKLFRGSDATAGISFAKEYEMKMRSAVG